MKRRSRILVPLVLALVLGAAALLIEPFWPEANRWKVNEYVTFAAAIAAIVVLVRILDVILFEVFLERRRREHTPTLLREIVSIALYAVLIAVAYLKIFDAENLGFVLTGTVVAAVLGLALQDTLGNLFAGISIHLEKTFDVGDVIRSGDAIGVVEWTSWRATRVRTFNNNLLIVPNSLLARDRIDVFPRENLNARLVEVSAGYEFPPARVIGVIERAVRSLEGVAQEMPAIARVADFQDSGVLYEVKYWTRKYELTDPISAEIRKAIWYAFRRAGISIPFPIRSIARLSQAAVEPASPATIASRIEQTEVFRPLSVEERKRLLEGIRVEVFGRGETILRAGEPGDSMFILEEGSVSVRRPAEAGGGELARLAAGEMFGEMALLTGERRGASIVAESDVVALEIAKSSLQPILKENPALAEAISDIMARRRTSLDAAGAAEDTETGQSLFSRIANWFGL